MPADLVTADDIRRLRQQQGPVTEEQVTPADIARLRETFAQSLPGAAEHERVARTGLTSRESYAAAAVGQERLGGKQAGFAVRGDIALSDTFEEKRKKFTSRYPTGDFRLIEIPSEVPGGGGYDIVFRRGKDDPFSLFDPVQPEMGDVADLFGGLPELVGEVVYAMRSRGLTLPAQLGRLFAGAGIGELTQQGVEEARGFQLQDPTEAYLAQPAIAGGTAALGGALSTAVTGPTNVVRGAGALHMLPGAEEAVRAGADLNLPELLPTQVARSPLLRRLGRQSLALSPHMGEYVGQQQRAAGEAGLGMVDRASFELTKERLAATEQTARDALLQSVKVAPTHLEEGGKAIQKGFVEWDQISRDQINDLYRTARSIESPVFDISDIQSRVAQIGEGTPAVTTGDKTINVSGDISGDLRSLINDIGLLKPTVETITIKGKEFSSTDQLIELERRARDLAQPPMGAEMRRPEALANDIAKMIRSVLDNPKNSNPMFREAWAKARGAARSRFQVWEQTKATINAVDREFRPIALADRLMRAENADTIRFVRNTLESRGLSNRWVTLKDAFKSRLMEDPEAALKKIDAFDPETRRAFLTDAEYKDFQRMDEGFQALRSSGVQETLKKQSQNAAVITKLMNQDSTAGIDQILKLTGGPNTPSGKSLRAGLIDMVVAKATVPGEGSTLQLDGEIIDNELRRLDLSGASKALLPEDKANLRKLVSYLRFVPDRIDPGASIEAASVAAGIRGMQMRAFRILLEATSTGRFLTSKAGRTLLSGQAKPRWTPMTARALGGMALTIAKEVNDEKSPERAQ
jgi:hypothetical protein